MVVCDPGNFWSIGTDSNGSDSNIGYPMVDIRVYAYSFTSVVWRAIVGTAVTRTSFLRESAAPVGVNPENLAW